MDKSKKIELYQKVLEELKQKLKDPASIDEKMDFIASHLYRSIPYFFWAGFYFPGEDKLTLGPCAGPPACKTISYAGVCGRAVRTKTAVVVENVHNFEGHIACDPRSNSEIVVPLFDKDGNIYAVFDVDSTEFGAFDPVDAEFLEKILKNLK
ncbi:MAG: GAF domain-containing protein [Fidelibacterota bacterium]